jgi:hypothetical protein
MGMPADSAALITPPTTANSTATSGTAATASSAIAASPTSKEFWVTIICSSAFNVTFSSDGTSTITDPANSGVFASGTPYSFCLNTKNSHYKFTPTANCTFLLWKSSRTS